MALIQYFLNLTDFASPLKSTIIPCIVVAYAIQILVAIPSIIYQSDCFFDASGLSTFLIVNLLSLYLPAIRAKYGRDHLNQVADSIREVIEKVTSTEPGWGSLLPAPFRETSIAQDVATDTPLAFEYNWRQLALSGAVTIWAVRRKSSLN